MAVNGETREYSLDISYELLGVAGDGEDITDAMLDYLTSNLERKMTAVGLKLIRGFNLAFWLVDTLATVYSLMGYEGVRVTVHMEYQVMTKHQAGQTFTVEGWRPQYITLANYR